MQKASPPGLIPDPGPPPQGFSLIEVILASGLVSFLLVGTAELLIQSLTVQRTTDDSIRVAGLLSAEAEKLRTMPAAAEELTAGEHEVELSLPGGGDPVTLRWIVEDEGTSVKKINFSLNRNGRPGRPLEAVLLLSEDLGF